MSDSVLPLEALRQRFDDDDGYLPDGRAEGVSEQGWARFLEELRGTGWSVMREDTLLVDWPRTASEAARHPSSTLKVWPSENVAVHVYPDWGIDGVFFDFDMREMSRQEDADALLAFMRVLSSATQRTVLLSYEGLWDSVFLSYESGSDAVAWMESSPR